jgi:hypothetical protein
MSDQARVVLTPAVTRDDVETTAWDLDFFIDHRTERNGDQPREDVWRTIDNTTWLHEIEDHVTGLRYLVVRGDDVEDYVRRLRDQLATVTHTDALEALADATGEDKLMALYQLGVAAPPGGNQRVAAALKKELLEDDDKDMRHAAVIAIAYTGYPELKDAVKQASEEDDSEAVRSAAKGLLDAYDAQHS